MSNESKKKEPVRKSLRHIAFARGLIGTGRPKGGLVAVADRQVRSNDWEFFTDRHGIGVYRAKVRDPLALRKGDFRGQVRFPNSLLMTGPDLVMWTAQKFGGEVPSETLAAYDRERDRENNKGENKPSRHSVPASTDALPEGWTFELKKTTSGRKYKVFTSPDNKNFQSFKKAKAHMEVLSAK